MPVRLQFDTVEAGGLHSFGGVGIVFDDAVDIPILDLLGKGAMGGLFIVRG